jgi:hypothetical protein
MLIKEGIASPDAALTFLEIPKTAAASFRLLDVTTNGDGSSHVGNPQIGNYYILNPKEGYVCTTGRAFERKGTVHPLHVVKIEGSLSLKDCMEDLFFLSILAWTRPFHRPPWPRQTAIADCTVNTVYAPAIAARETRARRLSGAWQMSASVKSRWSGLSPEELA